VARLQPTDQRVGVGGAESAGKPQIPPRGFSAIAMILLFHVFRNLHRALATAVALSCVTRGGEVFEAFFSRDPAVSA
jgi:hypothetical protein